MPAKTAPRQTASLTAGQRERRDQLKAAYLIAYDNFATTAPEVAKSLGITPAEATKLFRQMENILVVGDHVNGERTLTWQCWDTYDSITRRQAIAKFNKAFPVGAEIAEPAKTGRKGATGPRYSDSQILKGHKLAVEAARSGKKLTNAEIAAACGVKSPNYFAKVRRARGATLAGLAQVGSPAKGSTAAKKVAAKKPAKRAVKTSAKKATGLGTGDALVKAIANAK